MSKKRKMKPVPKGRKFLRKAKVVSIWLAIILLILVIVAQIVLSFIHIRGHSR
ncbi:hypothetical protein [uncultured Flavobacterium sp.]|jgi:hypothetical protein|uniref:hypothetical protein n=1 Tax=uncultured Flavobacterium sp. TaxID=165435 RepID=UPI0025D4F97B|nr:hypothetical protein [uncultured Flavobacterium sp.]